MNSTSTVHAELMATLATLLGLMEDVEEKAVKEWLPQMIGQEISLSLHECHTIDHIGQTPSINGVQLSEKLNVTRGGMSKLLTKLQQKNLIYSSRSKDNQKEIYYHLTEMGQEIFTAHAQIHQRLGNKLLGVLANYPDKNLLEVKSCLEDLAQIFWQESQ